MPGVKKNVKRTDNISQLRVSKFVVYFDQRLQQQVSHLAYEQTCRSQYCDPFVIHNVIHNAKL